MQHLKRLVITAVLAGVMLVATNFVSAPKTYADGPYYCLQWTMQYRTQLVHGAPRLVLVPDGWGHMVWRWISADYYTNVQVPVCVSWQTTPIAGQVIYPFSPPSIYDGGYLRYGYGYIAQAAFYGPYSPPNGFYYNAAPQ